MKSIINIAAICILQNKIIQLIIQIYNDGVYIYIYISKY